MRKKMSKKIKALIVDDEDLARYDLRSTLLKFPTIEIIGEANSVNTAVEFVNQFNPDIIFLDIQLQRDSGFNLLEKIDSHIKIIFVTAFDKYAIRAFEVNALDYLIKPVDPERLANTLERIDNSKNVEEMENQPFNYSDSVFLEHLGNYFFVKLNSIILITASAAYTEVRTTKGHKILAHKSMKEWENRLPQNTFVRIHRSTIVNIEYIEKIERWFNYSYRVFIKNIEKPLTISRRYLTSIRDKMQ